MNCSIVLYVVCVCLETISTGSLLNATVVEGPHPPLVDRTSGVKSHAQPQESVSHSLLFSSLCMCFVCACMHTLCVCPPGDNSSLPSVHVAK